MSNGGSLLFEAIFLLFSWLPPVLRILVVGALGLVLIVTLCRVIAFLWELLPFN